MVRYNLNGNRYTDLSFFLVLLPFIVSCNFQVDFDDDEFVVDVEAQLRQSLTDYENAINSMNWDKAIGFYAEDPRLYWIEKGNYQYESKEAIIESLEGLGLIVSAVSLKFSDPRIVVLSDNSAITRSRLNSR